MTHRFLSPAAAEAFAGVTPEQVREDLAHMEAHQYWPGDGGRPDWVRRLDEQHWNGKHLVPAIVDYALRFLADRAATVVDSEGRACRMQPCTSVAAIRYADGSAATTTEPSMVRYTNGERLDLVMLVPVEEGE